MPGEAWIVAEKISAWRQQPVDFKDPADRDLVLAWLYSELVRFPEKTHRYAARIDAGWDGHHDDESSGAALARVLAAPALFDPAVRSQAIEVRAKARSKVGHRWNPVRFAELLRDRRQVDAKMLNRAFRTRDELEAWREAWQRAQSAFDQVG